MSHHLMSHHLMSQGKGKVKQVRCGVDFSVALVHEAGGLQGLYVFGCNLVGQVCVCVCVCVCACMYICIFTDVCVCVY